MSVPASINDLSTTASSNSPAGSEPVFPQLDDHLRFGYSCIAYLRDNYLSQVAAPGTVTVTTTGVGIGTATPSTKLHAVGSAIQALFQDSAAFSAGSNGGSVAFAGLDSGGTNRTFSQIKGISVGSNNGALSVQTRNASGVLTEAIRVDASQNVGFTVVPSAWYSTYKAYQFSSNGSIFTNTDFFTIQNNAYVNSTPANVYLTTGYATKYVQVASTGQHQWHVAPSGASGATFSFTQAMTLDASGNLLLGSTSSVGARLMVYPSASNGFEVLNGGLTATNLRMFFRAPGAGSTVPVEIQSNGAYWVNSAGTNTMTLDASGNLSATGSVTAGTTITAGGKITAGADASANGDVTRLGQVNSLIASAASIAAPSGAVMAFAMSSAPTGWLKCNGAAVSRTTYAALFAAIGTTFGSGDGSTTFNLPDLRGEFIRGYDDGRGVDSGRVFGQFQNHAVQDHSHSILGTNTANGNGAGSGVLQSNSTNTGTMSTGNAAAETRPRNIALLYCIKT